MCADQHKLFLILPILSQNDHLHLSTDIPQAPFHYSLQNKRSSCIQESSVLFCHPLQSGLLSSPIWPELFPYKIKVNPYPFRNHIVCSTILYTHHTIHPEHKNNQRFHARLFQRLPVLSPERFQNPYPQPTSGVPHH